MVRGFSLEKSADIAADYTAECLKANAEDENSNAISVVISPVKIFLFMFTSP